jgi:hypothetical protein
MRVPYEYAILRLVPRVERGEQINVGVLLYCQRRDFLRARTHLTAGRLAALDPRADLAAIEPALRAWETACAGGTAGGPAARMSLGERFRWLTAPRSTILQPTAAHQGFTDDPAAELERLLDHLVR